MNGTQPAWVEPFLCELRRQLRRHGRCDVSIAAAMAPVSKPWLYRFRVSRNGAALREEWEAIKAQENRRNG